MSFDLNGWAGALRHALRTLRRSPGFAATVVGTLGLAIGTITAVFAVLDRVLLSPLPYAHPERLVFIAGTAPGSDMKGEFGPAARVLPPVPGRRETGRRRRHLRYLHQLAARRRPGRADPDGRRQPLALLDARGATGARPPAAAGGRGSRGRDQRRAFPLVVRLGSERRRALLRHRGQEPDHRRRDAAGVPLPEQRTAAVGRERRSRRGARAGALRLQHGGAPRSGATLSAAEAELHGTGAPGARALRRLARVRAARRAPSRRRAAAARRDARPRRALALDPVRRRRHRAGHRLRQRGEPLHGARRGPPARPRRAARDRGLARRSSCGCSWRRRSWRRSLRVPWPSPSPDSAFR